MIVDYLCSFVSGEARAASDAEAVAWATPEDLPAYDLPPKASEVVQDAFDRLSRRESPLRKPGGTGYPDLK